jgi:hypothetical protein
MFLSLMPRGFITTWTPNDTRGRIARAEKIIPVSREKTLAKSKQQKRKEALDRLEFSLTRSTPGSQHWAKVHTQIANLKRVIEGRPTELQKEKQQPSPGNPVGEDPLRHFLADLFY